MAGDWIKFEHCTLDKAEVVKMAKALAIDQDAVIGKLLRVWVWVDQQSLDGNALGVTEMFLDRITFCPGFAAALVDAGWLRAAEGELSLPNFERHNGQTAKTRAVTNKRVSEFRREASAKCNADVTQGALQKALPEKRREEYIKKPPIAPKGAREFDQFWEQYPKKVGKDAARKVWLKKRPPLEACLKAIAAQRKSDAWTKEDGQFIPNPTTWLNQGRWQDELVDGNGHKESKSGQWLDCSKQDRSTKIEDWMK